MKIEIIKWLGWILLIALLLNLKFCQSEIKTVIVPEKKGNFEAVKPTNKTIIIEKIKIVKSDNIRYQNQISKLLSENEQLKNNFQDTPDTIKIIQYAKAIELNSFSEKFDDSLTTINVKGISRGTLESLAIDYIIKKQNVFVPIKKRIGIYIGAESGSNFSLNQFTYKANLGVQNKKGTIYRVSYQQIGKEKYGLVGIDFKIL